MLDWVSSGRPDTKIWIRCAGIATLLEITLLTAIGWHEHWLAHPQKTQGVDETQYVEAQVFQMPPKAHLIQEKKSSSPKKETTLSKTPDKGTPSKEPPSTLEEENEATTGTLLPPNHGAVPVYSPQPVIPPYLQNKEIQTSVLIEFYVNSLGHSTPRLVGTSGEEELDAITIETVKKWLFRPAEKDHKAIDSKLRLRVLFEVR